MNTLLSKVRLSPTFDCNIRMAFESDIIKSYTIKTATLILLSKVGLICTFEHMWHEMRPYSRIIIRETGPLAPFYIVDPCDQIQDFYPDHYSQLNPIIILLAYTNSNTDIDTGKRKFNSYSRYLKVLNKVKKDMMAVPTL